MTIEIVIFRYRVPCAFAAIVDDMDVDLVSGYKWGVFTPRGSKTRYARASIGGKVVYMHRLITGAGLGDEIDHIDGNGLNNARSNLRFVTRSQNIRAAHRLPGRYGNMTIEELDRELEEFENRRNSERTGRVKLL